MKYVWLLVLVSVLLVPAVSAKEYHMTILAVSDINGTYRGNDVDLFLEIEQGKGRVFLETFPLTKLDTQISTRFAKEMACKYADKDCERYDFFYRIRSDSSIVGGPSASGAIAALTVAALEGATINESVSMTGTLNSGGIIGRVEGVKAKVEAAQKAGITTALVANSNVIHKNEDNSTLNLSEYGKEIGIAVIPITHLSEAVYYLTNEKQPSHDYEIIIDDEYHVIMEGIARDLCDPSRIAHITPEMSNETKRLQEEILNLTVDAEDAFNNGQYYASASYCFGLNIKKRYLTYLALNMTGESVMAEAARLQQQARTTKRSLDMVDRTTITDLQAYIIVKERLLETEEHIKNVFENSKANETQAALYQLSYAEERLYTTDLWSRFLGKGSGEHKVDHKTLQSSCTRKIAEAEERIQYLKLFVPIPFSYLQDELRQAYRYYDSEEYELCLFKATKVKSQANLVINSLSMNTTQYKALFPAKSEVAKNAIGEEIHKGIFPIMGYSYYEYAQSLEDTDTYSSMLYLEYALEMSNFDIYFPKKRSIFSEFQLDIQTVVGFLIGLVLGGSIMWDFTHRKRKKRRYQKFRKRIF